MVIFKQPKIGGKVSIHQDSTFLHTKPHPCMALWFALEDVHEGNACLWVAPGSHREGIVSRFRRNKEGTATYKDQADADERPSWTYDDFDRDTYLEKWVSVPVKKGSVVLIHGSLVHMSDENESDSSRVVYTFHMVDKTKKWSEDNWIKVDEPFKGFEDVQVIPSVGEKKE